MDDLISRQAAIDAASRGCKEWRGIFGDVAHELEKIPSVQPERPKGEWIHIRDEEDGNASYECSVCHMGEVHSPTVEVSYCWNCGADMRGEKHGRKKVR